jgi:tetratricopeptide (TPR) repeat protein
MSPGTVHPEPLAETLSDLRVHPSEIDGYSLLPFVPGAATVDQSVDERLAKIAIQLAEGASVHSAATWLMENQPADLTAVYYNTIDHMCHLAMAFHPPRMPQSPEDLYELYKHVVTETYVWHDALLGRLVELAGEDTTIILCSDHGFHSDHLRPAWTPKTPTGPTTWHRFHGALVMAGPGIKKDERVYGATLLDIAPTVLTLMGLPVGQDMDGKVLSSAFETTPTVESIPSWEAIEGECGMHPAGQYEEPFEAYALMKQMAELGYVEEPDESADKAIERIRRDSQFNRAQALLNADMPGEALPLLEDLRQTDPDHLYYALNLATCYRRVGRIEECRQTALEIIEYCQDEDKVDTGIRPVEIDDETWDKIPANKRPRIVAQADLLLGLLAMEEGNAREALSHFEKAEEIQPRSPHVRVSLGRCLLMLKRYADAERNFRLALDVDPQDHRALDGLSEAYLGMQRNEEAAEYALEAVGLLHHLPSGHFHLGVALARLQQPERAVQAFDHCIAMQPQNTEALRWKNKVQQLATAC